MGHKPHRDYWPGRVDLCPNQGHQTQNFPCFFYLHSFLWFHDFLWFLWFHNFLWRCQQCSNSWELPCLLFLFWHTCRGLICGYYTSEWGFSLGSGWHEVLGNMTNTRPSSSSTVDHWERPPGIGLMAVADINVLWGDVITEDLWIFKGCKWLHGSP